MANYFVILHDAKDASASGRAALKSKLGSSLKLENGELERIFQDLPAILRTEHSRDSAESLRVLVEQLGGIAEVLEELTASLLMDSSSESFTAVKPEPPAKAPVAPPPLIDLPFALDDTDTAAEAKAPLEVLSFERDLPKEEESSAEHAAISGMSLDELTGLLDRELAGDAAEVETFKLAPEEKPKSAGTEMFSLAPEEPETQDTASAVEKEPTEIDALVMFESIDEPEHHLEAPPVPAPAAPQVQQPPAQLKAPTPPPLSALRPPPLRAPESTNSENSNEVEQDEELPEPILQLPPIERPRRLLSVGDQIAVALSIIVVLTGTYMFGFNAKGKSGASVISSEIVRALLMEQDSILHPEELDQQATPVSAKIIRRWTTTEKTDYAELNLLLAQTENRVEILRAEILPAPPPKLTNADLAQGKLLPSWLRRFHVDRGTVFISSEANVSADSTFHTAAQGLAYLEDEHGAARSTAVMTIDGTVSDGIVQGQWTIASKDAPDLENHVRRINGNSFEIHYQGKFSASPAQESSMLQIPVKELKE